MKLALKWTFSILIAALFVWLSSRQWPAENLVCDSAGMEDGRVICFVQTEGGGLSETWSVNLIWLVPAFLILSLVHFLRVWRWEPLLRPLARFDFRTLNRVGAVSFMAVFIFPVRLGEFARPYLISKTGKLRKSAAFGTIAVERVMDGLMMALLLAVVLFFLPGRNQATFTSLRAGALVALLVFASAMAMLVVAYLSKEHAVAFVRSVVGIFSAGLAGKLAGMMEAFIDGMKAMPNWRNFFQFVVATVAYWGVNGLYYYFMVQAFGLNVRVGLPGCYAMMAAVAVGMMIPNSPANVGSFWYFLLLPVALYGPSPTAGTPLAFALGVWALMLTQYTLFAGYFLVTGKVSLESIWSIQKEGLENGD